MKPQTLIPVTLTAIAVFFISSHYGKVNSDYKPKDTTGIGRQMCDVMNNYDTLCFIIRNTNDTVGIDTIPEINYGGESGFLYHNHCERDTIYTSDLDLSVTYSDLKKEFIIYKGEVFFRADVVGEEQRAKEVLDTLKTYIEEANSKANGIPTIEFKGRGWETNATQYDTVPKVNIYSASVYDQQKFDTIKCIILYSDTATGEIAIGIHNPFTSPFTYWQYGYCVFDFKGIGLNRWYLDADKKQLPKSIIVWQSFEVK